jgi:exodeoxyribonuclease VII small subunit
MADPRESAQRVSPASAGASEVSETQTLSFEAALAQLERIVDQLEAGDLELEAALAAFEQGVVLSKRCAEQLGQAERRIEVLLREGEQWETRAFEGDPDASEGSE